MSGAYQPAYSEPALEALLEADAGQRADAQAVISRLCRTPGRSGDYRERDDTGRWVEVALVDGVLVTYWADHAVRELRISFIEFP